MIVALACAALLEGGRPFHSPLSQQRRSKLWLAVGAWLGFLVVHLAFQHSNLGYRVGPLGLLIGVAEAHRWHHKREHEDAQVNYGDFWMPGGHLFSAFRSQKHTLGAKE
ncbi:sterol desaturase family protein [Pseudomonas aeruginosa]|nr:sterol desaturase [Pseudomonas aeruginosa]